MEMRKILSLSLLLILLSFGAALAGQDRIPPPFDKIKEMVLKTEPDEDGDYFLFYETKMGEEKIVYILGYLQKEKVIGIAKAVGHLFIIQYYEEDGNFTAYWDGAEIAIEPQKAIDVAFKIFRELVERNFI
jgi:hypothetical protein